MIALIRPSITVQPGVGNTLVDDEIKVPYEQWALEPERDGMPISEGVGNGLSESGWARVVVRHRLG